jgi:hypothetical protein
VTMTWQGTTGSGTSEQAFTVTKVGAITFTINNTVIAPNYNSTVTISYTVRQKDAPDDESPSLPFTLKIENLPLAGTCTYAGGHNITGYFNCQTQMGITIPADLEVGSVILTSATVPPEQKTAYKCDTSHSAWLLNAYSPEPASGSTIFPTGVAGVGFRVLYNGKYVAAGPEDIDAGTYTLEGSVGTVEFIKTGPMTTSYLSARSLAYWRRGANSLALIGWYLPNGLAFTVVSRQSIESKRKS